MPTKSAKLHANGFIDRNGASRSLSGGSCESNITAIMVVGGGPAGLSFALILGR